jgi:hypothetical protein
MTSRKLNNKLHQMMNARRAGLDRHSGLNHVLWDLFCHIIASLNMTVFTWNSLMVTYVKKQEKHFQNRRDTASIRGNLNKEFTRGNMTWKVFCKGLMFLQVVKFKITLDLTFGNGRHTTHSQIVTFNSVDPFLPTDDEPQTMNDVLQDAQAETATVFAAQPAVKEVLSAPPAPTTRAVADSSENDDPIPW